MHCLEVIVKRNEESAEQRLMRRIRLLLETSLRAGRFPDVGDGGEVWNPADAVRNVLAERW